MNEVYLYFEEYIACLVGLIFIFRRIVIDKVSEDRSKYIKMILISSVFYIMTDCALELLLGRFFGVVLTNKLIFSFIYALYIIAGFIFMLSWFAYAHHSFYRKSKIIKSMVYADAVAVILLIQFLLAFYKDDYFLAAAQDGTIGLGHINNILYLFMYFPVILSLIETIINYSDKTLYAYRENIRQFLVYGILFIATGALQYIFPKGNAIILGIMAADVYLYVVSNSSLVFRDELTGLDNRRQLIRTLDEKMKAGGDWFLVIIDANSFKMINDVYGHSEGDRALTYISEALNTLSFEYKSLAYRYAGDEFVVIKEGRDEIETEAMCEQINICLKGICEIRSIPYKLSISYGFVKYDENEHISIPDIIKDADEKMYVMKETVHGRR